MENINIQVGQIWKSGRSYAVPRYVVVETVGEHTVRCRALPTGRRTSLQRRHMRPGCKGYELVTDPKILQELRRKTEANGAVKLSTPASKASASPSREGTDTDCTSDLCGRCQHIMHAIDHLLMALEMSGVEVKEQT